MKRFGYFAVIAACAAASVSCQEELKTGSVGCAVPMITKTMLAEGSLWTGDADTKSTYDPEVGITMTGNEPMDIFYGNPANAENASNTNPYMKRVETSATSNGSFSYSFGHNQIDGADVYDYVVITPYLSNAVAALNGAGTALRFELSPVQMPGQNSYDCNYDILYGKGQSAVAIDTELEVTAFKRITAPVRFELYDQGGALGQGEKIYAVTATFGSSVSDAEIAGRLFLNMAYDYEDCKVNDAEPAGNAATAIYKDGLAKLGDSYPVWFMLNPASLEAGAPLTVAVTTDRRTFVKSINIPDALTLYTDYFNVIQMNLSDAAADAVPSLYFDFTSGTSDIISSGSASASDGNSYSWTFSGCSAYTDASGALPTALRMNASSSASIILPEVDGCKITGIRLYANPSNIDSGTFIALNDGEPKNFGSYDAAGVAATGGVLEISVPEEEQGSALTLKVSGSNALISGIALDLAEDSSSEQPEIDENDWYSQYVNGSAITIDGKEYSQDTHGEAVLVKIEDLTISDLNQAGIIFIDNSGTAESKFLTANRFTAIDGHPEGNVIIGRYRDSQPELKFVNGEGVSQQLSLERSVVLKNIGISADAASVFQNGRAESAVGLTLEDCTLSLNSTVATAVVLDNNASYSYADVAVNNCVIEINSENTELPSVFKSSGFGPLDFAMTNSVVYAEASMRAYVVNVSSDYSDLNVSIADNTFNNIYTSNGLIYGNSFNSLSVKNNLVYDAQSSRPFVYCTKSCQTSDISGNCLYANWTADHAESVIETPEDSNFNYTEYPFTSEVNASAGYFPVDQSIITNGAGADYSTKYWISRN